VLIAILAIVGVVFYRISVLAALYAINDPKIYQNAKLFVTVTAALINLVIILILNFVREPDCSLNNYLLDIEK